MRPEKISKKFGYDFMRLLGCGTYCASSLVQKNGMNFLAKTMNPNRSIYPSTMYDLYLSAANKIEHIDNEKKAYDRIGDIEGVVKCYDYHSVPRLGIIRAISELNSSEFSPSHYTLLLKKYVEGEVMKRGKKITNLKDQVMLENAVKSMHKNGVVSFDLHPGNILISTSGTPYLFDFGLCLFSDRMTSTCRDMHESEDLKDLEKLMG